MLTVKSFLKGNLLRCLLVIMIAGVGVMLWKEKHGSRSVTYISGPIPHEAYVWQRHWNSPVRSAVQWADGQVSNLCILAGELEWRGEQAAFIHPEIDWSLLKNLQSHVSLAWRIPIFKDKPYWDEQVQKALELSIELRLKQAAESGVKLQEIQLDYDCPTRLLSEYEKRIHHLKQKYPEQTWTITALPAWLDDREMAKLAAATDGFVLQVHWFHRGFDGKPKILDDGLARRAIDKCAKLQVPFRVALPTYGNAVVMDKSGAWLDILAEEPPILSPDSYLVEISSDPVQMITLIKEWEKQRPSNFRGIIWYRLPVEGEQRNWRKETFQSVIQGQQPVADFTVELRKKEEGYFELILVNKGNADGEAPKEIIVSNLNQLAADGVNHYSVSETDSGLRWARKFPLILKAGQTLQVGWIREANDAATEPSVKLSF